MNSTVKKFLFSPDVGLISAISPLLEVYDGTVGALNAGPVTVKSNILSYFFVFDIKLNIYFFILSISYWLFFPLWFSIFLIKEDFSLIESLIVSKDFFLPVLPVEDHLVIIGLSNLSLEKCFCIPFPTLKSWNFYFTSSSP